MRAIVLFVSLGEADQTADELAVIAVQFDKFLMMLAAATGNILIRSYLIVYRHHLVCLCRRLTTMIPEIKHLYITNIMA